MRSMSRSVRFSATLLVAALTGCAATPDVSANDRGSNYRAVQGGSAYSGATIRLHGEAAPDYPRGTVAQDSVADLRDWRAGDGAFLRRQRALVGVGLEERQRNDRQERLLERRKDNADRARDRRGSGRVRLPGSSVPDIGEKFDQDPGRRMRRASQAERRAQRRAAEVRRRLRAERQAERGDEHAPLPLSAPPVRPGG